MNDTLSLHRLIVSRILAVLLVTAVCGIRANPGSKLVPLKNMIQSKTTAVTQDTSIHVDTTAQDEVALLFAKKCSGCHTIGNGKLTGPDLLSAAGWPLPEVLKKIKLMEKNVGPLSDADISRYATLLLDPAAKLRIAKAGAALLASMMKSLEPASALKGRDLFEGRLTLANAGPACISCHTVNRWGGSLGPDLTQIGNRMVPNALVSAIRNADFKIMRMPFKEHAVTAQEALHLAKYLDDIKIRGANASGKISGYIGPAGLGGAIVFLGALPLFFYRRHRSARAKLQTLRRQRT